MANFVLVSLLLATLLQPCHCHYKRDVKASPNSINFLALGDWGGREFFPFHTAAQVETAKGMGLVARRLNSSFVVALGDNFYSTGVRSETSRRFESTFERVYSDESLTTIPWFVIGGNHDHYGNITAQVEYTNDDPKRRWVFPSLYHTYSFQSTPQNDDNDDDTSVTVDLILIDTVDLCGINRKALQQQQEGYFDPLPMLPKIHASRQWQWMEDQLKVSTADYLLVGGHYPVYSVCSHGPTETLIHHLKPLLQKYKAHYLSGHDHCMVHMEEENTHYVLTGMGDECCYEATNLNNTLNPTSTDLKWFLSAENKHLYQALGGFTSFQATKNELRIEYHDHRGNVLYKADPILPRVL